MGELTIPHTVNQFSGSRLLGLQVSVMEPGCYFSILKYQKSLTMQPKLQLVVLMPQPPDGITGKGPCYNSADTVSTKRTKSFFGRLYLLIKI